MSEENQSTLDSVPDVDVLAIIDEARMHMSGELGSHGAREITDNRLSQARDAYAALVKREAKLRTALAGLQAENLLDSDPCDLESAAEAKSAARDALAEPAELEGDEA